ncbi:hypothetical protein 10S11_63 [uncultured Caudovirales phage]|uniref:HTH cro/C1-type domain-containing protein n=1 Tax=uncultured Caudovirales phage TaxID=2100421 RepID=A0A2H4J085_9CAUD|nr:hypothetical protein 10S11_63 [uncultured Caudovirales phage]
MLNLFTERLIKYREEKGLLKKEMAKRLNISESYYNLIESGKREPSKRFMIALVAESGKSTEYWRFGVTNEEYINTREDFKSFKLALEQLINLKMITSAEDLFKDFKGNAAEELLVAALKADVEGIMLKKENTNEKDEN